MLYVQQVDDGILAYRPALEGEDSDTYYIGPKVEEFAYMAKVHDMCMCVCVCVCVCVHVCTCV